MTPLRQRMLEDMRLRSLSPHTQAAYVEHPKLPGGGGYPIELYTITAAAAALGAENFRTFETDFGPTCTWYWHGVDVSANARLRNRLTLQGGTSSGRGVRDTCRTVVNIDSPDPRGCRVVEPVMPSIRGLVTYTVPKIDVLVSAQVRSLNPSNALPALVGDMSATNGASLSRPAPSRGNRDRYAACAASTP
jgi:hypothetical protein